MQDSGEGLFVETYGDGSVTDPTCWWAALGGFGTWMPRWAQEEETSAFGAAIGQTGSSTRTELMAWLSVLTLSIRSNYATDSAAMLGKAVRLIAAVQKQEDEHRSRREHSNTSALQSDAVEDGHASVGMTSPPSSSQQSKSYSNKSPNPFGKPWSVQTDGDLWELAWEAIIKRGAANQKLRKVKGHATPEDVTSGVAQADKEGNDKSDEIADRGVHSIGGAGLVKLANWAASRHDKYKKFMARIHKLIVAIASVEKEERGIAARTEKAILGYDPAKVIKSSGAIRKEDPSMVQYVSLQLPPPVKGKRKFKHCQTMYEQIHAFLGHRRWAHAHPQSEAGGSTWAEIFILFDIKGGRTIAGQHETKSRSFRT